MLAALGYVGFASDRFDEWTSLGSDVFGLQVAERTSKLIRFRMDERAQRLFADAELPANSYVYGWEVAGAAELATAAARIAENGADVVQAPRSECAKRMVVDMVTLADPFGNRIEIFHGAAIAAPFRPGRAVSGFRTGETG